jgi:hypothetical protein
VKAKYGNQFHEKNNSLFLFFVSFPLSDLQVWQSVGTRRLYQKILKRLDAFSIGVGDFFTLFLIEIGLSNVISLVFFPLNSITQISS